MMYKFINFRFDCWYLEDGVSHESIDIEAESIEEAIDIFENTFDDLGYDDPYEW